MMLLDLGLNSAEEEQKRWRQQPLPHYWPQITLRKKSPAGSQGEGRLGERGGAQVGSQAGELPFCISPQRTDQSLPHIPFLLQIL